MAGKCCYDWEMRLRSWNWAAGILGRCRSRPGHRLRPAAARLARLGSLAAGWRTFPLPYERRAGGRAGQIPGEAGFRAAGISGSQRAQASPPPSCRRPQGLPSACLSPKDLLLGRLIISLGLAIESQSRHQAGRRRWMVPYKNERQSQTVQASF